MAQSGIESVLVAGRGPAACGVITACARLGLKAVAVYSEAERSARHVRLADDAVLLGPARGLHDPVDGEIGLRRRRSPATPAWRPRSCRRG